MGKADKKDKPLEKFQRRILNPKVRQFFACSFNLTKFKSKNDARVKSDIKKEYSDKIKTIQEVIFSYKQIILIIKFQEREIVFAKQINLQ
jgi:hypothetical protein